MGLTKVFLFMLLILTLNFCQILGQPGAENGRKMADDTVRPDPLDHLRKYRGGYDITNKHYWSSTAYTGIAGYVLGVLWLLCGIIYGIFLITTTLFGKTNNKDLKKNKSPPCHKQCYLWHIFFATFFTLLAIVGTGLVLGGNVKFHSRAKTIIDIIIDTADGASETIYNTTGAMRIMSSNLQGINADVTTTRFLDSTSLQLNSRADDIRRQARKNRHAIDLGLKIVYIVSTVIFSLNLVAVIALTGFGVVKLKQALHILIVLCWLITVLCWLFFGAYFFLGKFAGDTCTALEGFQKDPYNNSLSSILPCDQLLSAESTLDDVSEGVYNLVNEVNANISRIQQDSSFGVCNPFSGPPEYNYEPQNCSENSIRIGEIPKLLKLITCVDPVGGICNGGIAISSTDFRTVEAYTTSIQLLLDSYPAMESLLQCQTVKDAFSEILRKHCKPVKRDAKIVWAGLVFLSIVMVFLVLTWSIGAHHERKRHFSDGSIKPHHASDAVESGKGADKDDTL